MHSMFKCMRVLSLLSLVAVSSFGAQSIALAKHSNAQPVDLVVYGGTASGIMTAYSAAREGLHVVLLEPGAHLGGMVTGGLSATDLGQFNVIGGYVRDFYLRAAAHYGVYDLNRRENWYSEPHVDEEIFLKMLADAGVDIRLHERLKEHKGVQVHGQRIESITTMDGIQWIAKVFADCSYEGDLMAEAGVTYTYGRESIAQYGENLAGVRPYTPAHQFTWPISAYDKHHKLLPEISPGPLAAPGTADKLMEAYTFRPILTRNPENRLPFPRPKHYDAARFALLRRYLAEFEKNRGRAPNLHDVAILVPIPNDKADFNNNGAFSTDYIGHSWNYPEGSYAEKQRIWDDNLNYIQSFFYFLSHDPSVPPRLQHEVNEWGLPKDEFLDSGHWPNQLYVREGRRMVGEYVMRQSDMQTDRTKPDSIGMGSYNMDSHNVQRVALPDGSVRNEGDMQVHVQPYEIPYRILIPQKSQVQNLLVTVCVSATHVAYSSLRMEPQYMIMGQAAGVAASLSVRKEVAVQDIPIKALQIKLRAHNAVLSPQDMVGK
ncbi:MAG: FAD-dependent oxidoreductase [Acidobacteriaceae bacterium]